MNELPEQNANVTVSGGPTSRELIARVQDVSIGGAMRVLEAVAGHGDKVRVRWISSRGTAEVPCTVAAAEDGQGWWLIPSGDPAIDQRRRFYRVDVAMAVHITKRPGDKALQAWAVDLSEGGMRAVTVDTELREGAHVGLVFDLPNGATIDGRAEILRCSPDGKGFATIVFTFHLMPELMQSRIRQFVFKSQLRAGAASRA